jgi:hypothetical protein
MLIRIGNGAANGGMRADLLRFIKEIKSDVSQIGIGLRLNLD